jgi:hypothetical protein
MKVRTKVIEFEVDFTPSQINFKRYELPYLIMDCGKEKKEEEEFLAWFLEHSIKAGKWVAVAEKDFDFSLQEAQGQWDSHMRMIRANQLKKRKLRKLKLLYYLKELFSIGLYGRGHDAPEIEFYTSFPLGNIRTCILNLSYSEFRDTLRSSYHYLRKNEYFRIEDIHGENYIYPTKELFHLLEPLVIRK